MNQKFDDALTAAYEAVGYSIPHDMVEAGLRAALGVLREPSDDAVEAGQVEVNLLQNPDPPNAVEFLSRDEVTGIWQAMIDAALK